MAGSIQSEEAARDIAAEARGALLRAVERGGVFKQIGEERLAPVVALVDAIATELEKAQEAAGPLLTAVTAATEDARARIAKVSDGLWSAVGRPASDAALSLLFPGGVGYYAEGTPDEQVDRMELLAELLDAGVHPKLPREQAHAAAKDAREAARSLRRALDAARIPRARLRLLERATLVVAQSAENELALVRRRLRAEGVSEAEINAVLKRTESRNEGARNEGAPVPEGGLKLA